jgi:hypothetical protein
MGVIKKRKLKPVLVSDATGDGKKRSRKQIRVWTLSEWLEAINSSEDTQIYHGACV